jgi:branched-chain amino acid transport system ATP-binding protein
MLKVKELKKYFGEVKAVDGVSFTIEKGEKVAILGPNGAGKTTLINLISGYLYPDIGTLIYHGKNIEYIPMHKRIKMGIVRTWQIPQLFEGLTVRESILVSMLSRNNYSYNIWKNIATLKNELQEADEIVSLFNLKGEKFVKELSEGERKLLDVALAFSLQPKLLLLDEPTSGVSTEEKFHVMETIVKLASKKDITLLVIEHDMDIVNKFLPRAIIMHEGKILADGLTQNIFKEIEILKYLVGE